MEEETVPLDKLVKIYRKLRTRMTELTQAYDTQAEVLKAQQDEIKNAIKEQMKAMGVTSVRTTEGTAVMSVKTRYYTQDWDSFKQFVIDNHALELFEKRIAQSNMAQFLEENPGVVPPGLNSTSEFDISVRKPT
jgi:glycerol-3-phosphate responsive antiterminator